MGEENAGVGADHAQLVIVGIERPRRRHLDALSLGIEKDRADRTAGGLQQIEQDVAESHLRGAPHLLVDGDVAALHRVREGLDHARIEARAGKALDLLDDVVELHRLLIRPVRGHGVERVGDGHDARLHRDLLAAQAVGIAAAAPFLVVVLHARDDVDELCHAAHDGRPFDGMSLHHFELVIAQRTGLAKDAVVDADLADVVQQRADAEIAHLLLAQAEVFSDADRIARHPFRMAARVRVLGVDGRGQHAHGIDEEEVVLMRRFAKLLDGRLDRSRHGVEVLGQLADLVVRLQLDALVVVAVGNLARPFSQGPDRPGDAGCEDDGRQNGQHQGDRDPGDRGPHHLRHRGVGHLLRLLHDYAPIGPADRRDRAEHRHALPAAVVVVGNGQVHGRLGELLHDLQIGKVGMLHLDRRLAVQEHLAVAVDQKRRHVAFSFVADPIIDPAQADDGLDASDDGAVVDDRHGDDDGRLVGRRDELECAGVDLALERGLQRQIELLPHRCIELRRLGLGAFAVAVENAQPEEIAVRRDVVGDDAGLRRVQKRIGACRQGPLHRPHACRDFRQLLRVARQQVLDVRGDADRRARQVLFLQGLQRIAVDADEEVVRDDQRHQPDDDHRTEERPEQARAALRRLGGSYCFGHSGRL